jgi:hypothetical protein
MKAGDIKDRALIPSRPMARQIYLGAGQRLAV